MRGEMITLAEGAVRARLAPAALFGPVVRGEIEAIKLGGRWLLDAESFATWLASQRTPAPAA